MSNRFLAVAVVLIALGACRAPSGTYEIAPVSPSVTVSTSQSVATSVIDRRPYVLNGDESDEFLGTERGNWGGEKPIKTASGRPVADELNDAVAGALRNQGIQAGPILPVEIKGTGKGFDRSEALAGFQTQPSERLLLVEVEDWRTDIYTRITLSWRLRATVFDRAGQILATSTSQGKEPVSRTSVSGEYADIAVTELSQRLSWLLNERQITDALR